ncbi:hypothetical protein CDAR_84951 [Caerostris darwini]|uniref:Uncharacterized protein n=1 Tax=Caerostris darwini TaxID=1538125 RepID=A0AAV4MZ60_9ARAC|nr:hypothetical protein CDAR_84951 [Caerostris darwini]
MFARCTTYFGHRESSKKGAYSPKALTLTLVQRRCKIHVLMCGTGLCLRVEHHAGAAVRGVKKPLPRRQVPGLGGSGLIHKTSRHEDCIRSWPSYNRKENVRAGLLLQIEEIRRDVNKRLATFVVEILELA